MLPLAPFKRIAKKKAPRVSMSAAEELREAVESMAANLARDASEAASHDGRITVMAKDVKLVTK